MSRTSWSGFLWQGLVVVAVCQGPAAWAFDPGYPAPNPPVAVRQLETAAGSWTAPVAKAAPTVEWTYHMTADGTHPDGHEQQMVWLMNRARANPAQEGVWLATSPLADIETGRSYFGVNTALLRSEFASYSAKPPAAFDLRLYNAAKAHSDWIVSSGTTDPSHLHDGQFDRISSAGFHLRDGRGNVFAWAENALQAHAAFNIDWGAVADGMQAGRGHRMALMSPSQSLVNMGVAMVPATTPLGPQVTTINYCEADTSSANHYNRYLVGTVWRDANGNGLYEAGEGLANIRVQPDQGTYYARTGVGGGYAIPILQPGTYAVTFSGFSGGGRVTKSILVAGASVLLDCTSLVGDGADAYEPDNTRSTAKRIRKGQTQRRSIHAPGNTDWAKFIVKGRGAMKVRITTAGTSGDTQMWLYKRNGTRLAYNDNGGVGSFSRIKRASLAAGTYYIRVREYGNNGTIPAYTLRATWTPR